MDRKPGQRGRGRGRGSFGDGEGPKIKKGYLDEHTMIYYRRVSDTLSEFKDQSDEEKTIFLNNAFSNLAEEAVKVAQNQTVSTIIESLIAAASPANLRTLFLALAQDLTVAFLDRFASHVFENLVLRLAQFFLAPLDRPESELEDDVAQEKFLDIFETVCEFVDTNFDETLSTHVYGSHVLRALLEALSGVPVAHELKKSQRSGYGKHPNSKDQKKPVPTVKLPEEFKPLFDKYADKIFRICDYEVHLKDPYFSLLLQAVLMMWHKAVPELCQKHCRGIVKRAVESCPEDTEPRDSVPDVAQDVVGSHLLEVIFKLSSADLLQQVFTTLLRGKLLYYAVHPVANYVLQSFIGAVKEKELMEEVFSELSQHIEDILAVGFLGLVTSLADACRRLRVKQDDLIEALLEAFHCKEPETRQKSLVPLLASLTTYEVYFKLEEDTGKPPEGAQEARLKGPINIHGSLILQQLLQFQKPKHCALGLVALEPGELQALCCDPSGSHVIDVFFSTPTVLEKNKDIFLKKIKGLLVELACDRNGSRCLESAWKSLNVKQRARVAEELAESNRLRGDRFGHFLFYNFGLALFGGDRKVWMERQGVESKRKRMMKELLHSAEPPVKKTKGSDKVLEVKEENEEEDSVTAMFLKHKTQAAAAITGALSAEEDSDVEESSPRVEKKSKRKKEKSKPVQMDSDTDEGIQIPSKKKKKKKKNSSEKLADPVNVEDADIPEKKKKKKKKQENNEDVTSNAEEEEVEDVTIPKKKKKKAKSISR